jgi:hypothetical protein
MAGPPPYPESNPHTTPRWVKISMIVVTVLILTFLVLLFTGIGGEHGPGRHIRRSGVVSTPSPAVTETGDRTPSPDVRETDDSPNPAATETEGHTPPPGMDHR